MEKLLSTLIISCFCLLVTAQDSLCVFKVKGAVFVASNSGFLPLKKGSFITSKSKVKTTKNSEFTAINDIGNAFNVSKSGNFNYKQILNSPYTKNAKGVTKKYFKLIWKKLTNQNESKTIIGGVFRGDELMVFPNDSSIIASSKISFKWKLSNENSTYYIFIKNIETDQISKFATLSTALTLYKSNPIFGDNTAFEWVVSTEEFPNLKNLRFNQFQLISKSDYNIAITNYSQLIAELKTLGLSATEIQYSICETYGLCK